MQQFEEGDPMGTQGSPELQQTMFDSLAMHQCGVAGAGRGISLEMKKVARRNASETGGCAGAARSCG